MNSNYIGSSNIYIFPTASSQWLKVIFKQPGRVARGRRISIFYSNWWRSHSAQCCSQELCIKGEVCHDLRGDRVCRGSELALGEGRRRATLILPAAGSRTQTNTHARPHTFTRNATMIDAALGLTLVHSGVRAGGVWCIKQRRAHTYAHQRSGLSA